MEALPSHSCRISAGQPARLRKSTYHLPWVGTSESCCSAPRSRGKAVTAAATGGATNLDSTEGRQTADAESDPGDARAVVEAFYGAINRRDLESALTFISDDCVYEDLIYPQPFTGKQASTESTCARPLSLPVEIVETRQTSLLLYGLLA